MAVKQYLDAVLAHAGKAGLLKVETDEHVGLKGPKFLILLKPADTAMSL